jgi:uncharacterized protein (DUF362 family)
MDNLELVKIKQSFPNDHVSDISSATRQAVLQSGITIHDGDRIAIAVGSRGITAIDCIVRAIVQVLKDKGAQPFIVPAMGSHGGGTAEGQADILAGYGITEETMGAPIRSSMDVVELPRGSLCHPVYQDRFAYEADGIIVVNRVKTHTDFQGSTESGLLKMLVICLGKHKQALAIHRYGVHGIRDLVPF